MEHRRSRRSEHRSTAAAANGYGTAATVLVSAVPMFAAAVYGAADVWALVPLSVLTTVLLLLWAADSVKAGELQLNASPLQLPILGLIAVGIVQLLPLATAQGASGTVRTALTLDPFSTSYFVIRVVLLLVFFAAALRYLSGKRLVQRVAVAVVIFGSVMAFIGVLQRLASPGSIYGVRPVAQAIPFGPFVNQHHFAAFMEMTVGLALAFLLGDAVRRDRKALFLIALLLMLIAVALTGSRGGMIGTFCVAAFAVVASRKGRANEPVRGRLKYFAAAAAVLVLISASVLFLAGADPLVRGLGMQTEQSDITNGRLHFWSVALRIFLDNPVLGAGFDAFGVAFTAFDTWNGAFRVEQAHNDYLQMLADGGLLAFACVAAFIYLLFRRGLSVLRNSSSPGRRTVAVGALAGCFGILVHSFFDFPLRTPSNAYFFLLLAAMATVALGDERSGTADTRNVT